MKRMLIFLAILVFATGCSPLQKTAVSSASNDTPPPSEATNDMQSESDSNQWPGLPSEQQIGFEETDEFSELFANDYYASDSGYNDRYVYTNDDFTFITLPENEDSEASFSYQFSKDGEILDKVRSGWNFLLRGQNQYWTGWVNDIPTESSYFKMKTGNEEMSPLEVNGLVSYGKNGIYFIQPSKKDRKMYRMDYDGENETVLHSIQTGNDYVAYGEVIEYERFLWHSRFRENPDIEIDEYCLTNSIVRYDLDGGNPKEVIASYHKLLGFRNGCLYYYNLNEKQLQRYRIDDESVITIPFPAEIVSDDNFRMNFTDEFCFFFADDVFYRCDKSFSKPERILTTSYYTEVATSKNRIFLRLHPQGIVEIDQEGNLLRNYSQMVGLTGVPELKPMQR